MLPPLDQDGAIFYFATAALLALVFVAIDLHRALRRDPAAWRRLQRERGRR